ncbi:MAG: AbrB family transcriptional regulator [Desulfobacca sp.]|nr:AbrB family transcriptional regulator [Desulfobacca sp.]
MSLVKLKSKYQVVIPGAVRKKINLNIGDTLEIEEKNGEIILKPVLVIEKTQAYFWSNEWQEGEKEAEAAKKKGNFKDFEKGKEAIKWLRS